MNDNASIIIAMAFAIAAVIVALAFADHIRGAQTVELYTPNNTIKSSQKLLLEI